MGSSVTSMIRIAVASLIGVIVKVVSNKWAIDIDGETLTAAVTGAMIAIWYAFAKWAEQKWTWLRLLGLHDPNIADKA